MTSTTTHRKPPLDEKLITPRRSHSFHSRPTTPTPSDHRHLRRPRTQPELQSIKTYRERREGTNEMKAEAALKRVLVNVTVQRSVGAVQVMAGVEWTVAELVGEVVRVYVKEGRRPEMKKKEGFGLHYSQFSLECLDSTEKLINLGSRNFFLCPKSISAAATSSSSTSSPSPMQTSSCPRVLENFEIANSLHWLMVFLM